MSLKDRAYEILDVVDNRKAWSLRVAVALVRAARRATPDLIIASGPPFSPFLAASFVASVFCTHAILDFRDPWSGDALPKRSGVARWRQRTERFLERYAVRKAAHIVATTAGICEDLAARWNLSRDKFTPILNGYDPDALITEKPPLNRLALLFAGTIYLNRSPIGLLEAIQKVAGDPEIDRQRISVRFVGDCGFWEGTSMTAISEQKGISDIVTISGPESRESVLALTKASNVLVNLAQGQRKQIPGKLFEQAAANRAVLVITEPDSATARAAEGFAALRIVPDDVDAISAELKVLYRAFVSAGNASMLKSGDVSRLSRERGNARFAHLVAHALRPPQT